MHELSQIFIHVPMGYFPLIKSPYNGVNSKINRANSDKIDKVHIMIKYK